MSILDRLKKYAGLNKDRDRCPSNPCITVREAIEIADHIKLLAKQRDELLAENASLKTEFSQCSGLLDDAHRHIEQLEAEVVFQRNAHDQAQALLLEQGHQLAASSTNYPWKGCPPCDGGSRAGYECPVCRQSDCRGCVKGGADGWIEWKGGECPVDGDVRVEVRCRGSRNEVAVATADDWYWLHDGDDSDILAYRVKGEKGGAK